MAKRVFNEFGQDRIIIYDINNTGQSPKEFRKGLTGNN